MFEVTTKGADNMTRHMVQYLQQSVTYNILHVPDIGLNDDDP